MNDSDAIPVGLLERGACKRHLLMCVGSHRTLSSELRGLIEMPGEQLGVVASDGGAWRVKRAGAVRFATSSSDHMPGMRSDHSLRRTAERADPAPFIEGQVQGATPVEAPANRRGDDHVEF